MELNLKTYLPVIAEICLVILFYYIYILTEDINLFYTMLAPLVTFIIHIIFLIIGYILPKNIIIDFRDKDNIDRKQLVLDRNHDDSRILFLTITLESSNFGRYIFNKILKDARQIIIQICFHQRDCVRLIDEKWGGISGEMIDENGFKLYLNQLHYPLNDKITIRASFRVFANKSSGTSDGTIEYKKICLSRLHLWLLGIKYTGLKTVIIYN